MHMFMCIYFLMLHFYVFMKLFKKFFGVCEEVFTLNSTAAAS